MKHFDSFNKTKWTSIVTAIVTTIALILDSIFNIIGLF